MTPTRTLAVAITLLAASIPRAFGANAGTLDPRFGQAGIAAGTFDTFVLQTDGRIVVADRPAPAGSDTLVVHRLLDDGRPDSSFGVDGTVEIALPSPVSIVRRLLVQASGRILVLAGGFVQDERRGLVVALDVAGSLDSTYGGDGLVTKADVGGVAIDAALSLDDGLIVSFVTPEAPRGLLARFAPEGTRDPTFGGDGTADIPAIEEGWENVEIGVTPQLRVLANGTIVARTYLIQRGFWFHVFLGFTQQGAVEGDFGFDDPSFGAVDGQLWLAAGDDPIESAAMLDSGHLVQWFVGTNRLTIFRRSPIGMIDRSFGTNGFLELPIVSGGSIGVWTIVDDAEDRLLVGGGANRDFDATDDAYVARVTAAGAPDTSFGTGGVAFIALPGHDTMSTRQLATTSNGDVLGLTSAGLVRLLGENLTTVAVVRERLQSLAGEVSRLVVDVRLANSLMHTLALAGRKLATDDPTARELASARKAVRKFLHRLDSRAARGVDAEIAVWLGSMATAAATELDALD